MGFSFYNPVKIRFGNGVSDGLAATIEGLGAKKALVVANSRAQRLACVQSLDGALFFSGVEQNPSCETVDEIAQVVRKEKCGVVVGIGGGSVLDAAKIAAAMAENEGSCRDFCQGREIARKGSVFIAVPTTAGTGSEASPISVITDKSISNKVAVKSPFLFADFAFVDPALSFSMPPRLTSSTGLDVVSHAIEGMCSKNSSAMTDFLNLKALELAWENLPLALEDGRNAEAREAMMLSSLLAGMCLGESGTTNGHPVSYALTLEKNLEHGFACALTLPFWLEHDCGFFNATQQVGKIIGASSASEARERLAKFIKSVGGPTALSSIGYSKADAQRLAGLCFDKISARNIREVSIKEVAAVLEKSM